ncbi:cytochrome c3 family protein [Geotalea sp. SG265]|uniref:cytochrome c3 family protein n=1 Tax=Geotalea sp. SG265 TaxID=2922867 RepID=UPI001FB01D9C|nr:cytochrome c3 family protein [Geotalea sp. SG265]
MRVFYPLTLLLFSLLFFLTACGSDNTASLTQSTFAASEKCITCHNVSRAVSKVTGAKITDEWARSAHGALHGASCIDCHGSGNGHPSNCGGCHGGSTTAGLEFHNPEKAAMCYKCHGLSHPEDVMLINAPQHFGNMTASISNVRGRASYVSSNYVGNCRKCHNPHDPSTAMRNGRQWARSGHGDTVGSPRTAYDFKTNGTYQPVNTTFDRNCVRCHTTTGYINFVSSGFAVQQPFAGPGYQVVQYPAASSDKTKEVTACNACHDDGKGNAYGFKLRSVPQVHIYYNYSGASTATNPGSRAVSLATGLPVKFNNNVVTYPNAGPSNMCISCHTGRGYGNMIKIAAGAPYFLNFSTGTSIGGSHAFPGAATLFQIIGYEYAGRDYPSAAPLHSQVGISNTNATGNLGPCITCHMNSTESHSFRPVAFSTEPTETDPSVGVIGSISSQTCVKCHTGTNAWTASTLQEKRTGFQAAITVLYATFYKKGVVVSRTATSWGIPTNYNWNRLYGSTSGPDTMGAYTNYNVLKSDWGAYAHNDRYVKRLIYDSIDWLNDGVLNNDVEAAINSLTVGKSPWNSSVNYSGASLLTVQQNAIRYLLGGPGGSRP